MRHTVSVKQLTSISYNSAAPEAFLNVTENAYGGIGVWTNATDQTYLIRHSNHTVQFIQFDSPETAQEWLGSKEDVEVLWQGHIKTP